MDKLILNDESKWSYTYACRFVKDFKENVSEVKDRKLFFFGFSAGC